MTAVAVARLVSAIAAAVIVVTGVLASGGSPMAIPFIAWALLPFGALVLAARGISNPWVIGGAGVAGLTVEAGIRAAVMLFPRGSTAAIALVFSPVVIGVIAMPAGGALGWAFGYLFSRTGLVVRALLTSAALAAVGLTFIFFARPELFPSAVMARQEALAAIGEPRIVAGGDRFTRALVSDTAGWYVAGAFDDAPGEDLAVVTHQGAQVMDVATLARGAFVPFGGERGRLWNWYSRLARIDGAFVVVQTGGGFSDTEVRTIDNNVVWAFKPDPRLPPTALLPGDLDEDGEVEFYASTSSALTRLNAAGAQVWNRPATLSDLAAIAPRTATERPWLVTSRYEMSVDVWSHAGDRIAQLPWPDAPVLGIVDWPTSRSVLAGMSTAKGTGLDGALRFEIPIDPLMRVIQALSFKPDAASPTLLAIVTGGDEDLKRWRLRVYATPETIVYDEVFDTWVRAFVVRHAGETATLFVSHASTLTMFRWTGEMGTVPHFHQLVIWGQASEQGLSLDHQMVKKGDCPHFTISAAKQRIL